MFEDLTVDVGMAPPDDPAEAMLLSGDGDIDGVEMETDGVEIGSVAEDMEPVAEDQRVERALLKAALGYTVTVSKPFKLKEVRNRAGEGRVEVERVEYAREQIHVPGKITAQIYWLRRHGAQPRKCVDPLEEVLRRWDEGEGEAPERRGIRH